MESRPSGTGLLLVPPGSTAVKFGGGPTASGAVVLSVVLIRLGRRVRFGGCPPGAVAAGWLLAPLIGVVGALLLLLFLRWAGRLAGDTGVPVPVVPSMLADELFLFLPPRTLRGIPAMDTKLS